MIIVCKLKWTIIAILILFVGSLGLAQGEQESQDVLPLQIGQQAFGTFRWVNFAIQHYGIDEEVGLNLEVTSYGSKQATEIALRSDEADIVVDDFIGVMLMRQRGVPVKAVYPYSLATGGAVVLAVSDINGIEDMRNATIAAASLRDKSLLILRALAVSEYGFDPQVTGDVIAASPPLMAELMKRGDIDVGIPYWHFVARMVGSGEFREVMRVTEMLEALGLPSDLPILVIVARDDVNPEAVRRYIRAFEMVTERMKRNDSIWQAILDAGLYELEDPSLMENVSERWMAGVPERWNQEVIDGLANLIEEMVEVAGAEVVGVSEIDPEAYTTKFADVESQ